MWEYLIIFFWCFLSASFVPASSEVYYIAIVGKYHSLWLPLLIATLGNTLGGLTTFYIGWKGGEYALKKLSDKNKTRFERASNIIHKYGPFSMVLSWIPLLGDIVVSLGGAFKLPIAASIFWMTLGKFGRYLILGLTTLGLWDKFFG